MEAPSDPVLRFFTVDGEGFWETLLETFEDGLERVDLVTRVDDLTASSLAEGESAGGVASLKSVAFRLFLVREDVVNVGRAESCRINGKTGCERAKGR